MTDLISPKQRVRSRKKTWLTEDIKSAILFLVGFVGFIIVLTQPGGFIK